MVLDVAPGRLIDQLGQSLGLTDEDLSAALNVSQRTLERWRVGEHYPQREARRRLAALTAVLRHLSDGGGRTRLAFRLKPVLWRPHPARSDTRGAVRSH